jgi:RNA polymerase sigma-70 factor (ECF subfamily)
MSYTRGMLAGASNEADIRAACGSGEVTTATTMALQLYGAEVLGYLVAFHKDYDAASDSFSVFSEHLWRSLAEFGWRCSLRTWCYRLARNAAIDGERGDARRREIGLSSAPEVSALVQKTRTETLSALRSTKRTALEQLRDELAEEDRTLLVLRVNRQLDWREIAVVLSGVSKEEDDGALAREAARLRKRFQLVKDRLRTLAQERGLR